MARGEGSTEACGQTFQWSAGDTFVLPAGGEAIHSSASRAGLYWVHDAPLLRYLGVSTVKPVFEPCFYSHRDARAELDAIARNPRGANANRVSVLLGNDAFPQTRTVPTRSGPCSASCLRDRSSDRTGTSRLPWTSPWPANPAVTR